MRILLLQIARSRSGLSNRAGRERGPSLLPGRTDGNAMRAVPEFILMTAVLVVYFHLFDYRFYLKNPVEHDAKQERPTVYEMLSTYPAKDVGHRLLSWRWACAKAAAVALPIALSLMEIGASGLAPFGYIGLWLMLGPATFAGESVIEHPREGTLRKRALGFIELWLRYRPAEKLQTAFLSLLAVLGLAVLKLIFPGIWTANLVRFSPWKDLLSVTAPFDFFVDLFLLLAAIVLIVKTIMSPVNVLGSDPVVIASRMALYAVVGYSVLSLMIAYCVFLGITGYHFALLMAGAIVFRF
jgi:hypothetical protein